MQQGEKDNCWLEQSPEKSTVATVPFFLWATRYMCAICQTAEQNKEYYW